jgi:subtilase family serine protease
MSEMRKSGQRPTFKRASTTDKDVHVTKSFHRFMLLGGLALCLVAFAAGAVVAGAANAALSVPTLAHPVTKVAQPVTTILTGRVSLPSGPPSLPSPSRLLGAASPTAPARALISLKHRNEAALRRFIATVSDPNSAGYAHYLTPAQFDARYAPSTSTVGAIESFARGYGLSVQSVPSNRAYVYVTGSVAQMERAFATSIASYLLGTQKVQAPTKRPSLPRAIAADVTAIEGLDTADVARPQMVLNTPPAPAYVNAPPFSGYWGQSLATQAPGAYGQTHLPNVVQGYTPQQLQGAYGTAAAIKRGLNGAGQKVAVIDAYSSPTITQDADTWSAAHGLPKPSLVINDNALERDQPEGPTIPTDVPVVGGLNLQDPQGWFGEETLDVEAVHAMAPGATIVFQGALSPENIDLHMAQNKVVSKNEAQIVSNSYGGTSDSTDTTSDGYWEQAAAQGIGVYFSSGDDGDQTAGGTDPASRSVDGGANSPYVTAVGGTTLAVGRSNNYAFETYWGTDTATLTHGTWGASTFQSGGGGGTSQVYAEPSWQAPVAAGKYTDYWKGNANAQSGAIIPGRVVPDVAMLGDPNSGFLMGQTEDFSAYANPGGYGLPGDTDQFGQYRIGGTSLSSPLFAGMMALADQAAGRHHGFANPALYKLYRSMAFHDIGAPKSKVAVVRTNYLNSTNAAGGSETDLRTTGDTGTLTSAAGYDDSTGLGSPNGPAFLAGLAPHSKLIAASSRR